MRTIVEVVEADGIKVGDVIERRDRSGFPYAWIVFEGESSPQFSDRNDALHRAEVIRGNFG